VRFLFLPLNPVGPDRLKDTVLFHQHHFLHRAEIPRLNPVKIDTVGTSSLIAIKKYPKLGL